MVSSRKLRSYKAPLEESVMVKMTRKTFSDETMKKVHWVRRMFNDWKTFRNSQEHLQSIDVDIDNVSTLDKMQLAEAICKFITEVKKVDGGDFPARTMYDIVICLQFWLESEGLCWKLLGEEVFQDLRFTLDNLMKQRTSAGVGGKVRQAEVLTFTDEDLLWSLGLLGTHNPQVLLNTILFSLGLTCALRAGKEHRVLRSIPFKSQFEFLDDGQGGVFFRFTEDSGLKTNKGGLKQKKVEPKVVDVFPTKNMERCPVRILMKYLSLLPKNRVCKALYLRPRKAFTHRCWFLDKPVGVNTLREVVKTVCEQGGLPGYYTNHSLRSSSATRMYHNGVEEQLIQEITGHKSLAVRSYKRTSAKQRQFASNMITGNF